MVVLASDKEASKSERRVKHVISIGNHKNEDILDSSGSVRAPRDPTNYVWILRWSHLGKGVLY